MTRSLEMCRYPAIGVNGVEVSLASVGENCDASCARLDDLFVAVDGHKDRTRRTAYQNRLLSYQPPATDDAFQITNMNESIDQIRPVKLGDHRCSVPRNETFGARVAENHAAFRIDSDDLRPQAIVANEFRTTSHCPARTGRTEKIIGFAAQLGHDFAHRLIVGFEVVLIGILIWPVAVRDGNQKFPDPIDA